VKQESIVIEVEKELGQKVKFQEKVYFACYFDAETVFKKFIKNSFD